MNEHGFEGRVFFVPVSRCQFQKELKKSLPNLNDSHRSC